MIEATSTFAVSRTETAAVYRQWVSKCLLATSDQGLISGSNFLLNLLLARWLTLEEYGSYTLAISIFMLLAAIHQGVLVEPMAVFGPARYREVQRQYLSSVLWLNGWFAAAAALLLAGTTVIAFAAGYRNLGTMAASMIGAVPCILLFWLIRGACYLQFRPKLAALGALVYALVVSASVVVLHLTGLLSPVSAILAMGLASLVVSCSLLPKLKANVSYPPLGGPGIREVRKEHLEYGRWAMAAGMSSWMGDNVWYWVVGLYLGVADVGALRAIGNLTLPMAHVVGALARLTLPHVSEVLEKEGVPAMRRIVYRMLSISVAASSIYLLIIIFYHRSIVATLYQGKFVDVAYLSIWLVGAFVIWVGCNSFHVGLRAMQAPSAIFTATGAAAVVAVVAAIVAGYFYGLSGVAAAVVLSSMTSLIVSWRQFRSRTEAKFEPDAMEVTQLV